MIPYGKQTIDQDDIDAVSAVLQSNWLTCGPMVEKFEHALAEVIDAKNVVSCSNGTTALHLAMLGLGIGSKDVVLVPAITFLASANAAIYCGASIIFVDVDPQTGLMTAQTLEEAILNNKDKNLRAVVNVHLTGQCEDLEAIAAVARKHNLLIIEDAAHAIGTKYTDSTGKEYPIGSNQFCDATTFSFHPVKTIAMGEGGAVSTNNQDVANKMRTLRSHGMVRDVNDQPWYYEMRELGYNYRISDINCALGVSQLKKLDKFVEYKTKLVNFYDESFSNAKSMMPITKLATSNTAWHLYVLLIDFPALNLTRTQLMQELKNKGIGTQVHYIPLYKQPFYQSKQVLSGCEEYYAKALSLPLFYNLNAQEQSHVINTVLSYAS